MPYRQLENIKSKHPQLAALVDALAQYISTELEERRKRIVPPLAAAWLKHSEGETLALLMLFEDAGLLSHHYEVVCGRKRTVLLTVSSKTELVRALPAYCKFCDEEHDADDLRVELVFEVSPSAVQVFQQHAFA